MILFPITNDDKAQLKRLNDNKSAIFALKKLFLNSAINSKVNDNNSAILAITDAFHQLSVVEPDSRAGNTQENLV